MDGVPLIEWLQGLSNPMLDSAMVGITHLGHESFYMILLPVLYWCVNTATGLRVSALFLAGMWLTSFTKDLLMLPRPFEVEAGVRQLHYEADLGYGFPSGHAMGSSVIWGYFVAVYRRPAMTVACLMVILLVSVSRMYLGLHYLSDILGGWLIAGVALGTFFLLAPRLQRLAENAGLILAFAPLLLVPIYPASDGMKLAGYLVGLFVGYHVARKRLPFRAQAPWLQQIAKALVGLAVLFGLQTLTRWIIPDGLLQVVRYALLGLWVTVGAPYIFSRFIPANRMVAQSTQQRA